MSAYPMQEQTFHCGRQKTKKGRRLKLFRKNPFQISEQDGKAIALKKKCVFSHTLKTQNKKKYKNAKILT